MSYILRWKNPALNANKAAAVTVPVGSVVSNAASLRFTGKGAPGYGSIQQENLMRLLENFADSAAPEYPTIGQEWFDTAENTLRICVSTSPLVWKSLGGIQVTAGDAPNPAAVGDIWFHKTGARSGVLYVYTGMGRFPEGSNTIGGWNQVWPMVETVAGREEYDVVLDLVNTIVGPNGSGALGKILPQLADLTIYDADLLAKHQANPDASVLVPVTEIASELRVDTTSSDWDMLLSAAKYAVSRLDLPTSMIDDISPVPFVSDGRPAPSVLTSLPPDNIRYPSLERRSNRRFGLVTLIRLFTETVNVLNAAVANRFSIKGINGATGANPTFAPTTEILQHAAFSGSPAGATGSALNMRFNFASAADMQSFLNSGGAIQVTMTHAGGAGAADTDLKNLLDSRGMMRLTADKTRVFANVFPPALSVQPISTGLKGAAAGGQVLTTQTLGGATVTTSAAIASPTQMHVAVNLSGGAGLTGTTTITFHVIRDAATYLAPTITRVYGAPLSFIPTDKTGSSFLV